VRSGGVLRVTTIGCAVLAAAIVVAAALAGHVGFGIGLAAGLLVGSLNGYVIQGMLERRTPFRIASLGRLIGFSSLVLVAVLIFGTQAWTLPLGIGLAQLVMVAAGVRQGLRA
jgi:O-antigen/teichoic acid export membrane protein